MENADLDRLRYTYKEAVDHWIEAIRAEEDLVTPDHSMMAAEEWDRAHFVEQDAQDVAKAARQAYADELRKLLYNI